MTTDQASLLPRRRRPAGELVAGLVGAGLFVVVSLVGHGLVGAGGGWGNPALVESLQAFALFVPLTWALLRSRRRERLMARYLGHSAAIAEAVQGILRRQDGPAEIVRAARAITDATSAVVWQPDQDSDLVVTCSSEDALLGMRSPVNGDGVVAGCFRSGTPVWVTDADDPRLNGRLLRSAEATTGHALRSGVSVPIITGGRCLGVLALAWTTAAAATRDFLPVLELLAAQTALALDHQNLVHELERQSTVDPLTGLANRRAWDAALDRAARDGAQISVLMIDLDHFKAFNDVHGHAAGDRLLSTAAAGWQPRLRPGDVLCRWGGEEFAVLLQGCSRDGAHAVAADLRAMMPTGTTCSVGIAQWDGSEPVQRLVERADDRLYAAKAAGRDRVVDDAPAPAASDLTGTA